MLYNTSMTKALTPLDKLSEDCKLVYQYLPELLLDKESPHEISKLTGVEPKRINEIVESFLHDVWSTEDDKKLVQVVERLTAQSKARFLMQAFKATKQFTTLWQSSVDNLSKLNTIIGKKIDNLVEMDLEGEVSDRELKSILDIASRYQKQMLSMMDSSPLAQTVTQGGFQVVVNNAPLPEKPVQPSNPENKKEVVIDTTGYVEPPDFQSS